MIGRQVLDRTAVQPQRHRQRARARQRRKRIGLAAACLAWGLTGLGILWLVGVGILTMAAS